jgi:lipoprotein LprG
MRPIVPSCHSSPMQSRYRLGLSLIVTLTVSVLAGCSGSDSDSGDAADPAALLTAARTSLDGTNSLHFTLTSTNVPTDGTRLVAGQGVVARPNSFQGKLSVLLNGSKVSIDLVCAEGKVYAKLPFSDDFQVTDPATFGLSDPANLIDAKTGISRMFGELTGVTGKGEQRIGDDVVTEVDGSLPGQLVDDLLTSADPAKPVKTELYITKSTKQLRRVVMTGPFFDKAQDSTFNLLLDKYGDPVTITAPTSS